METTSESRPLLERVPPRWRPVVVLALPLAALLGLWFIGRFHRDEPVTYKSSEEHFKYGSTGGERSAGIPYWVWQALPSLFPDFLPGGKCDPAKPYAAFGFLYEPGKKLPIGVSRRNVQGLDRVFLNCAVCHVGTYRTRPEDEPRIVVGMPANGLDLQAFERFLFNTATDERFSPGRIMQEIERLGGDLDSLNENALRELGVYLMRDRFLLLRTRFAFMDREPDCGPGRVDTFNPPKVLMNFRMDKLPEREWVGNCDLPAIWYQRQKEGMQLHWDGNNTSVEERNRSAAFGTGANPPTLDRPSMRRMEEYIRDEARPAPFPVDKIDRALAARGEPLYLQHCGECHGRSGTDFSGRYVGKVTPIDEVKTDRHRLDSYTYELCANQGQLYTGYESERFKNFRKTFGYANMPLDGLWLRAPYLHNGSVPTLRDLMNKAAQRPKKFFRGYDVYDFKNVGFLSNVAEEGGRKFFEFDTQERPGKDPRERNEGNANIGHEYGTDLPNADKDAIVEFLKTF